MHFQIGIPTTLNCLVGVFVKRTKRTLEVLTIECKNMEIGISDNYDGNFNFILNTWNTPCGVRKAVNKIKTVTYFNESVHK